MMWKKSESEESHPQPTPMPQAPSLSTQKGQSLQAKESAVIGSTISIKGDLAGEEDLLIEGRVEGKIELRHNSITIGKNGHIRADIFGKIITVEGTVEGNLYGEEHLVVRHCGTVRGNITAPRVALEDGCNFKGSIDMSPNDASILPQG
jgi:cytoskeletal protein CcmA (bactofilin family)